MLNGIGNVELVGSIKIGSTEYTVDQLNSQLNKNTTPIGTIFYHISSVPPEGAFLLNGQVIYNCSTLYPEFYQYVTSNNGIRKITSSAYESELSAIGMCGGFVVDSENGSIRLPNISNGFIEGSNGSNIGNTLDAGLPNITGSSSVSFRTINAATDPEGKGAGAIRCYNSGKNVPDAGNTFYDSKISFDASLSNSIYGNSNTVQPKSVCYSVCIQVFNTTTSLSYQESTQLASEMQGKAGVNADNFTSIGKSTLNNIVFELDFDNAFDIPAASVIYQASRAGIAVARGFNGTVGIYTSQTAFDINQTYYGDLIGMICQNNGSVFASTFVPKNYYYITNEAIDTLTYRRFIPFKNS